MTANRLGTRSIEKVWGRQDLPRAFGLDAPEERRPVGEIWFEDRQGARPDLLVKYLLTSEKLSIQVHPDAATARANGYPSGKDEAWLVVAAEPGARIGLGLSAPVSKAELRAAALDGRIEAMIDWREVCAGDVFFSPAGTIHALGPGLTLVEIQQNVDVTYRLYDYGRPRELHLDEAIAAAIPEPYVAPFEPYTYAPGREILVDSPAFVIERWTIAAGGRLAAGPERPVWLIPVQGGGLIDGQPLEAPTVWIVEDQSRVRIDEGSEVLFAYPGQGVCDALFVDTRISDAPIPGCERRHFVPARRIDPIFR